MVENHVQAGHKKKRRPDTPPYLRNQGTWRNACLLDVTRTAMSSGRTFDESRAPLNPTKMFPTVPKLAFRFFH